MKWILQDKDYGLGNFINLTPTIIELGQRENKPIPVYFESGYVKEAFNDWAYISVLEKKPTNQPILSSSQIDRSDKKPDYEYVADIFGVSDWKRQTSIPIKKLAVFINGCANPNKRHTKDPGGDIYDYILNKIKDEYVTVFVGSGDDENHACLYDKIITWDIQLCLTIISKADIIISNDTGLYHAAGAMRKDGFILWKNTLFKKNDTPNENFFRSREGNWKKDFDKWIAKRR